MRGRYEEGLGARLRKRYGKLSASLKGLRLDIVRICFMYIWSVDREIRVASYSRRSLGPHDIVRRYFMYIWNSGSQNIDRKISSPSSTIV